MKEAYNTRMSAELLKEGQRLLKSIDKGASGDHGMTRLYMCTCFFFFFNSAIFKLPVILWILFLDDEDDEIEDLEDVALQEEDSASLQGATATGLTLLRRLQANMEEVFGEEMVGGLPEDEMQGLLFGVRPISLE